MDCSQSSKLLEFRSRQIHHIKQRGTILQITILRCCLKLQDQQSNKSATLCGITQQIPNKQKIILHISDAIEQWRRRWSIDSPHPLHIKNHSRTTKCLFRRLSIVKILPKAAVQEKKATRGGTFDCHTIFQGKGMMGKENDNTHSPGNLNCRLASNKVCQHQHIGPLWNRARPKTNPKKLTLGHSLSDETECPKKLSHLRST